MQQLSDQQLLREFAARRSEAAFGEIVRRHADLVYSAALRQVGNEHQARDVAQTVFVDLAAKAGAVAAEGLLIGWLYRGTRLAALQSIRSDRRWRERERQVMELKDIAAETPDDWSAVRPVLDEALGGLGVEDRDAVLLRFFKNESLASVGAALGVSEDAAQKRVARALEKLREALGHRGIKTTAAALSVVLTAHAVQAAPSGFVAAALQGAVAASAAASTGLTLVLKAALMLTVAGGIGVLAVSQFKTREQLQQAEQTIRQQADEIATLRLAADRSADQTTEMARLRAELLETLRLRAEVTQLRHQLVNQSNAVATQPSQPAPPEQAAAEAPQVGLVARIFAIPEQGVFTGNGNGMLTETQAMTIIRSLESRSNVLQLGRASIVTANGRRAEMLLSDDAGNDLLMVDALPEWSGNTRHIKLSFGVFSLAAGQGTGTAAALTNSLTALDGTTLMTCQTIPLRSGDRRLLVFLTPTLMDPAGNRFYDTDLDPATVLNSAAANPSKGAPVEFSPR